jgi:hypothetical protein
MKALFAVFIAIFSLSACTSYPNSLSYRPKGSEKPPYVITSEYNELTRDILLFVNGDKIISGKLSFLNGTGEFFGKYEGHNVNLSCRTEVAGCMVLIDNEFVGTINS